MNTSSPAPEPAAIHSPTRPFTLMSRQTRRHRGARRPILYESWTNIGLHEDLRCYAPGDKLVYGHLAIIVPHINVRAELLAELAAMCDHDDRYEQTGRAVGRLAVGDVVVLEEGSAWSLAPIGVVHVNVDTEDQIRDGRSWTEVLDENLASFTPIDKTIAELADDRWLWQPSNEVRHLFT